jgi:hypothetical protein
VNPLTLIQLALGFLKLANWIAAKVDQAQWKRLGYEEAMRDQLVAFKATVGVAETAALDAAKMTPEERRKLLMEET